MTSLRFYGFSVILGSFGRICANLGVVGKALLFAISCMALLNSAFVSAQEASSVTTRLPDTSAEATEQIVTAENYAFDDAKQRRIFLELTAVLRCPMCQNQNIADSDAMIAHDMRRKVYQLLKQGNSRDEVIDFMKARYGDFVYYQPPVTPVTIWLWALPVIFAVVMMFVFIFTRKKKQDVDIQDKLAAANKLLKDE